MKTNIVANSIIGKLFHKLYKNRKFKSSDQYWEQRYANGGNSGAGSYNCLSEFKADIINDFVKKNNIADVIEFGCGDGNQLQLANYPNYIGLDVSKTTLQNCINLFKNDSTKSFYLYNSTSFIDNHNLFQADLAMSLDVIYHLIEDETYNAYMTHLFAASKRFVIIYSSDNDGQHSFHVKEHKFTDWVGANCKDWTLIEKIDNKYPYNPKDPKNSSISDFYVYQKN